MGDKILPIIVWPNDKLRNENEIVSEDEFGKDELKELVEQMITTMKHYGGVGIAAPQVGVNKRILIATDQNGKSFEMINPVVTVESTEQFEFQEGCLSFPAVFQTKTRPQCIKAAYRTCDGSHRELTATNVLATIIQHENDHLNGILFVDDYIGNSRLKHGLIKGKVKRGNRAREKRLKG